jgi:regulator of protease activity HflC (stomatin/prohibitin superfamily)
MMVVMTIMIVVVVFVLLVSSVVHGPSCAVRYLRLGPAALGLNAGINAGVLR